MRLVLIDNRILDHQSIINSLTDDTEYLNFEFRCDIETIKSRITKSYESVAIIQHNYNYDVYRLVIDCSDSIVTDLETVDPSLTSWQEYIDFLLWLKTERGANYIDLLACDLWANPNWRYMIETVRTMYDIYIRASIDITGEGGDFILESDNFDTIGVYFTESILQYKYNFYYNSDPGSAGNVNFFPYTLPPHNLAKISSRYSSFVGVNVPTTYTDVVSIVSTFYVVGVLRSNGNVNLFGSTNPNVGLMPCGIVTQSQLVNIKKVVTSGNTFLALKNDGTIVSWGFVSNGRIIDDINTIVSTPSDNSSYFINVDSVRSQLVDVVDIYTNGYQAYAALTSSGKVVTWGYYIRGANVGTAASFLSSGIVKIFSGIDSFVALKNDGTAVTWGGWGSSGPVFSTTYYTNSKPIVDVVTTRTNVTSLYIRKYGTTTDLILSNSATPLYTLPENVFVLKSLSYAKQSQNHFFLLLSDNTVASYQNSSTFILYNNVTDIILSSAAIGMIQDGNVVVSGFSYAGGSLTDATYGLKPGLNLNNPVRLVSSGSSIGVIKSDNTFVWIGQTSVPYGSAYYSATFPTNDTETTLYNATSSNVKSIYSCASGYLVVKNDGNMATLGTTGLTGYQKTTDYGVKDTSANVMFEVDAFAGFIALEIPNLPLVTPSSIPRTFNIAVSYYVSNPDLMAIAGRTYQLYYGETLIDTFYPTLDTHTYVFSKVNMPTMGTFTLDIKDVTTIAYAVTSFQIDVFFAPIQLTISIPSTGSKNISMYLELISGVTVYWGDGSSNLLPAANANAEHTYSSSGTYTIALVSSNANAITQIGGGNLGTFLTAVNSWGGFNVTSLNNLFENCANPITYIPPLPSTVTSTMYMFINTQNAIPDITVWDTSNVTNMTGMFQGSAFNQNISTWNTGNVTNMSDMFAGTSLFNQQIGNWDVSNVTNMYRMFHNSNYNQSLGNWTLSSLTSTNGLDMLSVNRTMSVANINDTLYGWSQKSPLQNNVYVGMIGYYSDPSGTIGYNTLVNTYGWYLNPSGSDLNYAFLNNPAISSVTPGINSLSVAFSDTNVGSPSPVYYYSFNGIDICGNSFSSSPVVIPNLTLVQTYTFYIIARNVIGDAVSLSASGQPFILGTSPVIDSVTRTTNSLTIYFTQSNKGHPDPTYYYSFDGITTSGQGTSSSPISITGLSSPYNVYIIAANSAGNVVSAPTSGELYRLGSTPVITNITPQNNSLLVDFTQTDVGVSAATYYYSFNGTDLSGSGVSSSPITIPNLTLSQTYTFYIIASNDAGNKSSLSGSGIPLVTGSVPVIDSVTPGTDSLSVAFTQSNVGNPAPTYYYSFNGTDPSGEGVSSSPIVIPNLTLAQTYTFYIISSNSVGNVVSLSSSGEPFIVGSAPQINSVVPGTNKLTVSFVDASGFNPAHTTYYSLDNGATYPYPVHSNPFDISGLTTATVYFIKLKSSSSAGFQVSNTVSGEPFVVGSAPQIDSVVPGTNKLTVSFTDASGFNPVPSTYYSLDNGETYPYQIYSSPFVITELTTAAVYYIKLKTSNVAGFRESNTVSGEPLVVGYAPQINRVDPSANKLTVSFTDASGFNPAHTTYYSLDNGATYPYPVPSNPFDISGLNTATVYFISLKASNTIGFQVSNTVSGEPLVIGSAAQITSIVPGTNKLTVSFTDASGFNPSPTTYYSLDNGATYPYLVPSNPFDISGLTTITLYYISLKSSNIVGSQISNTVSGEPLIIGSAAQINSVVPGANKLTVSFVDASGFNPEHTNYYSLDNGSTYPYPVPSNPFDISGLTVAIVYYIRLKSSNSAGFQISNTVSGEPLVVGFSPEINSVVPGTNKLTVSFTDASGFNPTHDTYYSLDNGATYPYLVPSNPFDISGLTTAAVYFIKLKASNSVGFQVSNTVSGEPLVVGYAPRIDSVVPGDNKLTVSFVDASGFNPAHTTYYSLDNGVTYPYPVPSNPFDISGLTVAAVYYIKLKSENAIGFQVSNTVSGEPLVVGSAPQINSVDPSTNKLIVSFTDASGFNPAHTNYYSLDNGATYPYQVYSNPFDITGLTTATVYFIKLKASNSVGFQVSNTVSGEPLVVGSAPHINSVIPSTNKLTVSFTDASGFNPSHTTYYSLDNGATYPYLVPSNPFDISGLTTAVVYFIKLKSENTIGFQVSNTVSGEPLVIGSAANINSVVPGDNKLTVSFTEASGFNPAPITYYSLDNGATYPYPVPSNPFDISGLTTAVVYFIKLKTENIVGFQVSNTVSGEPLVVGSAPQINSVDPGTNKLTVSFTDASGFNPAHTTYYSLDNGETYPYPVPSNPFDISGLTTATVYFIKLKSSNSVGFQESNTVSGEPIVVGYAPRIDRVDPSTNKLTVSFTDASGFNPAHTTYYSLDNGATYPYPVPSNPFDISGLTTAIVYFIKLKSENTIGFQVSNTISGEPLVIGSAAQINSVVPGTNKLTVSFTDASGFNPAHDTYYSLDNGSTYPYLVPSNPFDISGLTTAAVYYIKLKTSNIVGFQISNTVSGEPFVVGSAPRIDSVVPGTNILTVSFTDASGFNPEHTNYYSLDNGATYPYLVPSNPFDITGLTVATVYYIIIKSSNSAGYQVSNTVSGEPLVIGSSPQINSIVPGINKLTVSFTDASGFNPAHTTYYSTDNGATYPYPVPSNPFDIAGLTTATVYFIKLKSSNSVGFQASNTVSGEPFVVGDAPQINSVVPGTNKLTVSFADASGFNPVPTTSYSLDNGATYPYIVPSNPFDISGLTTATVYFIKLKMSNVAGFQVSNTVSGEPRVVGYAPRIDSVDPSTNKLTVSFTDASGFNPVHTTYYSLDNGLTYPYPVPSNPFDISGLTTATIYYISLKASNDVGYQISNTVSGEPLVIGSAAYINSIVPGANKLTVSFTDASGFNPAPTTYYSLDNGATYPYLVSSNPFDITGLTVATVYYVSLKSSNSLGFKVSNTVSGEPLVIGSAPLIDSVVPGTNKLTVSFADASGFNPEHTTYYSLDNGLTYPYRALSNPFDISGLTTATVYYIRLKSSNNIGFRLSNTISGEPLVVGSAPQINRVDPSTNKLTVSFTDASGFNPAHTTYYSLDNGLTYPYLAPSSPFDISGLTTATIYYISLKSSNSVGFQVSNTVSGEPLVIGSAPQINRVDPSTNKLTVSFTDASGFNPAHTTYYSLDNGETFPYPVPSNPFDISGLSVAIVYFIKLKSINSLGFQVSNTVSGEPLVVGSAPQINTIVPGTNKLTVSFTDASGFNPLHDIYYSLDNGATYPYLVPSNPFDISGLTTITLYYIRLKASNSAGFQISNTVSGEPLIIGSAPYIDGIVPGTNKLTVSFVDASGFNPSHTTFYSLDNGATYPYLVPSNPFDISGLTTAAVYYISLKSSSSAGFQISNTVSGEPLVVGSTPQIDSVVPGIDKLTVSFTDASGFNPAHTTYYSLDNGSTYPYLVPSNPFDISGLTTAAVYYISLKSFNTIGFQVSNTVSGEPLVVGSAPRIDSVVPGDNKLTVSFLDASGFNPAPTTYYSLDDGATYPYQVLSNPFDISGLTVATVYFIKLKTSNIAGFQISNTVSGEPLVVGYAAQINSVIPGANKLTVSFIDAYGFNPAHTTYYSIDDGVTYPYLVSSNPFDITGLTTATIYYVRLKSSNSVGFQLSNTGSSKPLVVGSAANINSVVPGDNKLTVSFTDASGYNPTHVNHYSLDNGATYPYLITSNPFDILELTTATIYYISIESSNSVGFRISNTVSGQPRVVGFAPRIDTVSSGTNKLTVSFTDASGFNPAHTTYYSIDNGATYPYLVPSNPFDISGLTTAVVYYISLKSSNSVGFQVSNTVSGEPFVVGSAPYIDRVDPSTNKLTVFFTDASGFNPAPDIYYSLDNGATYPYQVDSNPFEITGLTVATVYYIKLKASNIAGFQVSNTVSGEPLVVGSSPIIDNITSATNSLIVAFSQLTRGNPAETYYYSFNGTDVSGSGVSASPLVIPNLTLSQYYTFYIIAMNAAGSISSLDGSGIPNVIGSAAIINSITPGINTLSVAFTGSSNSYPEPTYYYSFNGTDICGNGVSASPITIPDLMQAQTYTFYIIASNIAGTVVSDSSSAVPYAKGSVPEITEVISQNSSLLVNFAQSNVGNPASTYYYSFNGTDASGQGVSSSPITIPNLTLSQYYTFYIIATNTAGNISSSSGSGKPLVTGSTPIINSVTPQSNSLLVDFAQLTLGNPLPTYYYSFNGIDICGNGVPYSPIMIPNLTLSQYYTFYIVSSNSVGNVVSSSASGEPLVTGSKPEINRVDVSTNSLIVSFTQSNRGNPAPTYYCSFNGTDLSGQGVASSPITIPNLTEAQTYTFYILSSNTQGNVASDPSLGQPYVINNRPVIDQVDPSKNSLIVSFTESTNSNPAPTYYYSFNGTTLLGQGTSSSPIAITDLSMAQTYTFYIIASNIAGTLVSDSSSAKPHVIGSKPAITNINPALNSLEVSFSASTGGYPAPMYYYSFNGSTPIGTGVSASPITIRNLTQLQYYTFYIIASNVAGNIVSDSSAGKPLIVGTAAALDVPVPGKNSLTVSFTDASGFNPLHTNSYSVNGGNYQYAVTSNPFVVDNLDSLAIYSISMKSSNSVGYQISNTVVGEPLIVGTAALLNVPVPGQNSLTISFTDASGFNPLHTNYYSINGGSYQYAVTSNPFIVSNLDSATVYSISMKSSNSVGYQISNTVSGEPLGVGTAPYINSVTPDINKLIVDFNDASGFNPVQATYYSLDGGETYPYLVPSSPTFIISKNTATVYYISLKAANSLGFQISNTVSGQPLVVGTAAELNVPVPGVNSLSIDFTDASGFNPRQTTYYSLDGGATYPTTNVVTSSPLVLTDLSKRAYSIRFISFNIAGSLYSNTVSEVPYFTGTAPVLDLPVSGINRLTISFTDASGFNPSQTTTQYTLDSGVTYNAVPSNPFTLQNLENRTYTIQLKSFNIAGTLFSSTVSGEPYYTGTAPVLGLPVSGTNSLTISFTDASGFYPQQTNYYSLDGGETYPYLVPSNPFTLQNLENRIYNIKLKSVNIAGELFSSTVSGEPYYTGTVPVLGLPVPGTNSLEISFTDASGFYPQQTNYYSLDGGATYPYLVPSNPFTIQDLANRIYYIRLKSANSAGELFSSTVSGEPYFTGTAPVLGLPVSGTNSLAISFTDASGFNPQHVTQYALDGSSIYNAVPSNPFTLQNLENRTYTIQLKSFNIAGALFSSTVSGEPYYTGTAPVLNLLVSGTNSLAISFTDASGFFPQQTNYYSLDGGATYPYLVPSNPFTIQDLETRVYFVRLKSANSAGELFSSTVSGEPYFTGTAPVLGLPVPGTNRLTFSFTDASGFNPQHVTEYALDGSSIYNAVPSNPFTLQNLENREYTAQLKSYNIAGALFSSTVSGKPYFTGTTPVLNSPVPGTNSLEISFTDASGFYPQHTTQYTLDGGATYNDIISNPFTLTNLAKRVYAVQLRSFNIAGTLFSSTVSGEPLYTGTAAELSTPVPGINSLTIPFTDAYGFNPQQTTYYLYSTDGGVTYSEPIIVQSNPLILTGLSNQTHFVKFKSSNSIGDIYSNVVSGTSYFLGTVPYINSITPAKNSLIMDYSGSVGGNPASITYYSLDGGATYTNTPVTSSPFTINLPATRSVYYITLKATNLAGNLISNTVSGEPYVVGSNPIITKVDASINSLIVEFTQSQLGNPTPTYYYSFNGIDPSGQGVSSSPITIPDLLLSKYYIVYIIAVNLGGNVVSLSASGQPLVVGSAPVITAVTPGLNRLIVDFSQNNPGNPAPNYYYSFDGNYIDFSQNIVTESPMIIPNLTIAQFYTFYIVSVNSIGQISSLSASGKPYVIGTAPTIIDTSNILNGDIVLNGLVVNFTESSGGNPAPDTNYYSLNGGNFIDSGYATSPMVITGLNQPSPYLITIKAHNFIGNTSVSNSIVGTPYIIANPPVIYDISSGINSMTVSFMPAYNGYPAILTYFYSIDGENYIDAQTTTSPIVIDGLTKYGPYNVTLIASSLAGYTQPSNSFIGKAFVIGDGPVIENVDENFNGLVVTFKNPTAYPVPTEYYYSIDGVNYNLSRQTDLSPLYINQLQTGTSYNVSLYSVNAAGESPIAGVTAITLSSFSFYANVVNSSYNRRAPIFIGPQPKSNPSLNGGTVQTAVSTRAKFSTYVGGTAGSRR